MQPQRLGGGMDPIQVFRKGCDDQYDLLKGRPCIYKFPISILNRLKPFLNQSDATVNFGGTWKALDCQIEI